MVKRTDGTVEELVRYTNTHARKFAQYVRGFEEMEMEVEEPQKEMEEVFGERYLLYLNIKD